MSRFACLLAIALLPGCGDGDGAAEEPLTALDPASTIALDPQSFVDVTALGADPSGMTDSTTEIQNAIKQSCQQKKVCYFPPGQYRISRTLKCIVDGSYAGESSAETIVLAGSRAGGGRPTIFLANNAITNNPSNFVDADPGDGKYVIHFWNRRFIGNNVRVVDWNGDSTVNEADKWVTPYSHANEQGNSLYNCKILNMRIEIRTGNPGAIAVRMQGAQGTGLQDVEIDLLEPNSTGVSGACGSGGSHANVSVDGGRIGLDLINGQPAPTIVGMTLTDQSEAAIIYGAWQTLSAVGIRIETSANGPVIRTPVNTNGHSGQIALVDSRIECGGVAIRTSSALYLRDVYVKGAPTIVQRLNSNGSTTTLLTAPMTGSWTRVPQYARGEGVTAPVYSNMNGNYYSYPIWVNGVRQMAEELETSLIAESPGATLCSKHVWDANFPSWDYANVVNALDYGVTRDNPANDDSVGIEAAIAANPGKTIFLPKGVYHVSHTVDIPAGASLIGVARHLSVIRAKPAGDFGPSADVMNPKPVLQTADTAMAQTKLAWLKIDVDGDVGGRAYGLSWRCGGGAIVRSVNFENRFFTSAPDLEKPFTKIWGHGGGRWYEFYNASGHNHGSGYRHLLIRDTTGPLRIYQCNPEHALPGGRNPDNTPMNLPNMEILNASRVSVFGLKGEANNPLLWVANSSHVLVFGTGGNANALAGQGLIRFSYTNNWLVAGAVDFWRSVNDNDYTHFAGAYVDPATWNMIRELRSTGTVNTLPEIAPGQGADRPIIYVRGSPDPGP